MDIEIIKAERALSMTNIDLADYVINPYKGCQIGCTYCYSRSNKSISKIKKEWGEYVYVKSNIPQLLEKELQEKIKANGENSIKRILIGSTTEPFQPVDEQYKLTSQIIEILKSYNIPFVILTKMNYIANYFDLIQYSPRNKIYFTYNCEEIRELFEKRSFSATRRLDVIEELNRTQTDFIVYISPVFPYLTDIETIFQELNGKTKKIYMEGFNAKIGNWNEIRSKLSEELISKYEKIFFNKDEYDLYWNKFRADTDELNKKFNFDIQYFMYPFDSYYNS